jgi:ABC-type multidrug transport system ATPase subunit
MLVVNRLNYNDREILVNNEIFEPGSIYLILGKNNSGKTSFCNALASCNDKNILHWHSEMLTVESIHFTESGIPNFFFVTGKELLMGWGGKANMQFVLSMARELKLPLESAADSYSVSEKRLLSILLSVTFNKEVYLFDDPFVYLDADNCKLVNKMFLFLKEKGKIVIITSSFENHIEYVDEVKIIENYTINYPSIFSKINYIKPAV